MRSFGTQTAGQQSVLLAFRKPGTRRNVFSSNFPSQEPPVSLPGIPQAGTRTAADEWPALFPVSNNLNLGAPLSRAVREGGIR